MYFCTIKYRRGENQIYFRLFYYEKKYCDVYYDICWKIFNADIYWNLYIPKRLIGKGKILFSNIINSNWILPDLKSNIKFSFILLYNLSIIPHCVYIYIIICKYTDIKPLSTLLYHYINRYVKLIKKILLTYVYFIFLK